MIFFLIFVKYSISLISFPTTDHHHHLAKVSKCFFLHIHVNCVLSQRESYDVDFLNGKRVRMNDVGTLPRMNEIERAKWKLHVRPAAVITEVLIVYDIVTFISSIAKCNWYDRTANGESSTFTISKSKNFCSTNHEVVINIEFSVLEYFYLRALHRILRSYEKYEMMNWFLIWNLRCWYCLNYLAFSA